MIALVCSGLKRLCCAPTRTRLTYSSAVKPDRLKRSKVSRVQELNLPRTNYEFVASTARPTLGYTINSL
ncbi:MAG: hypothetical protein RLZZ580_893 [Cyanobacteriota bacterium]|jgi:hypothetical protein